jgi:hypothetical protein
MNTSIKPRIIFLCLVAIALALLMCIAFIILNYVEKSKWTYIAIEPEAVAEMEEGASMYGMDYLRVPESVATDFFRNEGYGDPTETKVLKSGAKIVYLMTNDQGLKVKMELIQPGTKGETGVWVVKRYIADPLPEEEAETPSSAS